MDKCTQLFHFAVDEAKTLRAKVKGCMSKTKNTTKRATLTLIEGHGDLFSIPV